MSAREGQVDSVLFDLLSRMVASAIHKDFGDAHVRAFPRGARVIVNFPTDMSLEFTVGFAEDVLRKSGEIDGSKDHALAAVVIMLATAIERSLVQRLTGLGVAVNRRGH